jgi:alcohol dehydrogenase
VSAAPEAFDFQPRTRLVFGRGAVESLGDVTRGLGARRVLLVTDPGVARAGHAALALRALDCGGLEVRIFQEVIENPTDRCVAAGLEAARSFQADHLVAVGGGSAMDTAKGIGLLLTSGGSLRDYRGTGKVARALPSLVAVPTTAGTGSEVQSAAVLSDARTGEKMVIWDRNLAPAAAVLDPALTLTMPPAVTAATGIDALSHALESYVSTRATPLSRLFGRDAFRLLLPALARVMRDPGDSRARADMLLGAALAGLSIENSMLGAAHALANPLTAHYGITHGVAVGLVLPHVVRHNGRFPGAEERYGELEAAAVLPPPGPPEGAATGRPRPAGTGPASRIAGHLAALLSQARLPGRLRDSGVEEGRLSELAREAAAQWTASFNPVPVGEEELLGIYREAY